MFCTLLLENAATHTHKFIYDSLGQKRFPHPFFPSNVESWLTNCLPFATFAAGPGTLPAIAEGKERFRTCIHFAIPAAFPQNISSLQQGGRATVLNFLLY